MLNQSSTYDCAPKSLINACRALGIDIDESAVEIAVAPSPRTGADETKLIRACGILEIECEVRETSDPDEAYEWLIGCLSLGFPVMMCVEEYEHWVTAVGVLRDRVIVADPWDEVVSCDKQELLTWWSNTTESPQFYGLIIRGE